jgi:hypothetical protein
MVNREFILRVIAIVIAVIGLWVLLQTPTLALEAGTAFVQRQGGSASTDTYLAVIQLTGQAHSLLGAVLLGVGLVSAIRRFDHA